MDSFKFTSEEWESISSTLDKWADTLVTNDDRQFRGSFFGKVSVDGHEVIGMCALGALSVAVTGEYPVDEFAKYDEPAIREGIQNWFVLDLVARTAARQNGVEDLPQRMRSGWYAIPYLNDEAGLTFIQIACAVKNTRAFIAEHVVIVAPEPVMEREAVSV